MKTEKERIEKNLAEMEADFKRVMQQIKTGPGIKPVNGYIITVTCIHTDNRQGDDAITGGAIHMKMDGLREDYAEIIVADLLNRVVDVFTRGTNEGLHYLN